MFKLSTTKGILEKARGLLMRPIQYEVRVPSGDWSSYFGKYENQKWGMWDSNSCWALSGINCIEDQLEFLSKTGQFSAEAMQFFKDEGYIDTDGDFSLSERFIEILSGIKDNGNDQMQFWILAQEYGLIPRSDLTYTQERSYMFASKEAFNYDYFNKGQITQDMYDKGQKFLFYVNIARQWIGKPWTTPDLNILRQALKQAPLQYGVPVPVNVSNWNNSIIPYDGRISANHAIEGYKINDDDTLPIFDQYLPNLKVLGKGYLLSFVTQGIITPQKQVVANPVPQDVKENSFWTAIMNWWNDIFSSVQVGSS